MNKEDLITLLEDRSISIRDFLEILVKKELMTTKEVLESLDISCSRLTELKKNYKLVPVKKGLYLRIDVEKREREQKELRKKYYKSK